MFTIRVWKKDPRAKLPERSTEGSIGYDIFALEDSVIPPGSFALVRTGIVIVSEPPYGLFIFPRSSLFKKKGLIMPNSAGIIDFDYCGEEDEILIPLYNLSEKEALIRAHERIAQAVFIKIATPELIEISREDLPDKSRGGFGSTGGYK